MSNIFDIFALAREQDILELSRGWPHMALAIHRTLSQRPRQPDAHIQEFIRQLIALSQIPI